MLSAIAASVGEGEVDENESDSLLLLVDQYFPNYDFGVPGARTSRNEQPEKDSEVNVAERALIWEKLASILASGTNEERSIRWHLSLCFVIDFETFTSRDLHML